ncbi:MAG: flavodoxin domain-containing protein [Candidatus Aminicenantes bacterium]|nr:flavodoxin domain-containing protein [Candidatus Aminicenantes bacterium]
MDNNSKTNILILYRTKYGSTEQYARWIAEDVRADLFKIDNFDTTQFEQYSRIIIGSPTYMGKIQISNFLKKYWDILKTKQVFLFNTGLFPGESPESKKSFELIPAHIREHIEYIKLPGKIDMKKLKFTEKMIARLVKTDNPDKISKDQIGPITDWAKKSDISVR